MICLIALVVFGILGIFSARYRNIAKEAFNCVFRRITLRRCETGFDRRMKAKITGKLMARSPKAAGIVHRHFEAISWAFTILMIASMVLSLQAVYNYAAYGNCNGKQGGFCIFNAASGQNGLVLSDIPLERFPSIGPAGAPVRIVEFGCFQCPYTKAAEPEVKKILEKYPNDVRLTFIYAPTPHHYNAVYTSEAAVCAARQGKFSRFKDELFLKQEEHGNSVAPQDVLVSLKNIAKAEGLNTAEFEQCMASGSAAGEVQQSIDYAKRIGITQTPTFYINGKKLAGTISESDVKKALGY